MHREPGIEASLPQSPDLPNITTAKNLIGLIAD